MSVSVSVSVRSVRECRTCVLCEVWSVLFPAPVQDAGCCRRGGVGSGGRQVLRSPGPSVRGLPRGKGDTFNSRNGHTYTYTFTDISSEN